MGTFTVPGDGSIDFEPIFKVLEETGYEGYMLVEAEQDPAKANPLAYAIKARKYIAEHTGCNCAKTCILALYHGDIS